MRLAQRSCRCTPFTVLTVVVGIGCGLDSSYVTLEKFPLVVAPVTTVATQRFPSIPAEIAS